MRKLLSHKRRRTIIIVVAALILLAAASAGLYWWNIQPHSVWVSVPGNSTFGTHDFWVMKYDASCTHDGAPLTFPIDRNSYDNDGDTVNLPGIPCTPANGRQIASLPGALPITDIILDEAKSYCGSIGAHLITNNEWQTIAWNLEGVGSNWNSGTPGVGYMYSGHNDGQPQTPLAASADDSQGYYGEENIGGNQRRTLTLSNGSVIWDMAGNLWQWTDNTIAANDLPYISPDFQGWAEFSAITHWVPTLNRDLAGPMDPAWNSSSGIGEIYTNGMIVPGYPIYAYMRGGVLDYDETAGIESLGLFNAPNNPIQDTTFRCVKN